MGKNWFCEEVYVRLTVPRGGRRLRSLDPEQYIIIRPEERNGACEEGFAFKIFFQRDWEASFEVFAGQIYDEFRRELHVITKDKLRTRFKTVIAGKDWGFVRGAPWSYIGTQDSPKAGNGI